MNECQGHVESSLFIPTNTFGNLNLSTLCWRDGVRFVLKTSILLNLKMVLTVTLKYLTWKIWWAPNNASRWQVGFNSAFKRLKYPLTLIVLTWRIWCASNNASRWQVGFKSAFKGLKCPLTLILLTWKIWWGPNNASRWQVGFNSAFKGLSQSCA